MKKCWRCGRVQPNRAEHCECGTSFTSPVNVGQLTSPNLAAEVLVEDSELAFQAGVSKEYLEKYTRLPTCPNCFRETDSLKSYGITTILFLGILLQWSYQTVTACPKCMRAHLLRWGVSEIFTANILWPFLVFPSFVFRLLATLKRGHARRKKTISMGCLQAGIVITGIFSLFLLIIILSIGFPIVFAEGKINGPALAFLGVPLMVLLFLYGLFCWLAINAEIFK